MSKYLTTLNLMVTDRNFLNQCTFKDVRLEKSKDITSICRNSRCDKCIFSVHAEYRKDKPIAIELLK